LVQGFHYNAYYYSLDDAHVEALVDVALEHAAHTGD
jgi:hypothetical protein